MFFSWFYSSQVKKRMFLYLLTFYSSKPTGKISRKKVGAVSHPRRDHPFARDPGLAEAAASGGGAIELSYRFGKFFIDVCTAASLIVPLGREGTDRAAADAKAAAPLPVEEAVVAMVGVRPARRGEGEGADHAADAVGDPPRGDEGVV